MWEEYLRLMLSLLQQKIVSIGKQQGASQEYIQGQLNEAHHQVELLGQKLRRSNKHGF
jgi:hypothetical protein